MAYNVKKVIKVGTNTMGCGEFGEAISYVLPQSHVTIRLPFTLRVTNYTHLNLHCLI